MSIRQSLLLMLSLFGLVLSSLSQVPDTLTVEWLYSAASSRVAASPTVQWLDDSRLAVYERGDANSGASLLALTPGTGERARLADLKAAQASLRSILGDAAPGMVPFPETIDSKGRRGVYTFSGDIFLLDLGNSSFIRVTSTAAEEKAVTLSPTG